MSKVIDKIRSHPLVESISDEREWERRPPWAEYNGDGFWVYLEPGYINPMSGTHCIHEETPSECFALLRGVAHCEPGCECDWDVTCTDCGATKRRAGHAACPNKAG